MPAATREEIADYLAGVPCAHKAWVDALYVARLPMSAVDRMVQTMSKEVGSPLRTAEDSMLSKEIVRVNGVFGDMKNGGRGNGQVSVKINAVLTRDEAIRLNNIVGNFCQPDINRSRRFGHNGHAVANAARRCATGYQLSRISKGARVLEVGPDVKHWITDTTHRDWKVDGERKYVGSRPVMDRRDVVRVSWQRMGEMLLDPSKVGVSEEIKARVEALKTSYDEIFPNQKVQDMDVRCDFVLSFDANYDIAFADMPRVLERTGARGWYGYMNRAKGLTSVSRVTTGKLEQMGVNYRVDWKVGRIDFRHPNCNAFGYSHNVWELMKYEERNGYVWTTQRANYVYAKGPETNDELLFFSVVRVPLAIYMQQPSYVLNPVAGKIRIKSVWAIGGWSDGVPTLFEPIEYDVDAMAFSKIFEKRIAVDVRGDVSQTLTLVKSTNVRLWLNGTPVGTDRRIETQLIEATAVAVEVLAAEARARGKMVFDSAMGTYSVVMNKQPWVMRMLESVMDLRSLFGSIAGPISRNWSTMRGTLLDAALSPLRDFTVSAVHAELHIKIPQRVGHLYGDEVITPAEGVEHSVETEIGGTPDGFVGDTVLEESVDSETGGEDGSVSEMMSFDSSVTKVEEASVKTEDAQRERNSRIEHKAMSEFISLESFLRRALHTEVRIDANRLRNAACVSDREVLQWCTTRTQHTLVKFQAHRAVKSMGYENVDYGAIYDITDDVFVPVSRRGAVVVANVRDGWYYTNNRMKVWNLEAILESVEFAMAYGSAKLTRKDYKVTLGVPGAGKTYSMMRAIASEYKERPRTFLVLSVTSKACDEAINEGLAAGMPEPLLRRCVRTMDSYLVNNKGECELLAIDEFPMAHAGKIDAIVAMTRAREVRMFGDGRQIPYDPFTVGHVCELAAFGDTLNNDNVVFLSKSHRLSEDACAAWVDVYPSITSCTCCRVGDKVKPTLSWKRIGTVHDVVKDAKVRYHTYTRADNDELKNALHFKGDRDVFKKMKNGGISTVHEDQGATHMRVMCVRVTADYDKKASPTNPSLFNRLTYVLTDMTRHKEQFEYCTASTERDGVVKRVECARHAWRLHLVRTGATAGLTSVLDMLTNRYHPDIVAEKTLSDSYISLEN